MKTISILLSAFLVISLQAQSNKKEIKVSAFNKINASTALNIEYVEGTSCKVELDVPVRYQDNVEVSTKDGVLKLNLNCDNCSTKNDESFHIIVTAPQLDGVKLSGACSFSSKNILSGNNFKMDISGASSVKANIMVSYLDLEVGGASSAKLAGKTKKVDASIGGASSFKGQELAVETMKITCMGVSNAKVNVSENLISEANGMSKVSNAVSAKKQSMSNESTNYKKNVDNTKKAKVETVNKDDE